MVAVVLSSKSFSSVLDYHYEKIGEGRAKELSGMYDNKSTALHFLNEASDLKALKGKAPKSDHIFHHVLSMASSDNLSDEELSDYVREYVTRMGFRNNNMLLFLHTDTDDKHIHIVGNRLDNDSLKRIEYGFEKLNAVKAVDRMAPKYGLKTARFSSKGKEQEANIGAFRFAENRIAEATTLSISPDDYKRQLLHFGIRMHEGKARKGNNGRIYRPVSYKYVFDAKERFIPNSSLKSKLRKTYIDKSLVNITEKEKIQRIVTRTIAYNKKIDNLDSLSLLLNREGIFIEPSLHTDGKIFGIKFIDESGNSYKGSDIGISWKQIEQCLSEALWTNPKQKLLIYEGEIVDKVRFGEKVNKEELLKIKFNKNDFDNATHIQRKRLLRTQLFITNPKTENELIKAMEFAGKERYITDGYVIKDINIGGVQISELFERGGYKQIKRFINNNAQKIVSEILLRYNNNIDKAMPTVKAAFSYDEVTFSKGVLFVAGEKYFIKKQKSDTNQSLSAPKTTGKKEKLLIGSAHSSYNEGSSFFKSETLSEQEERIRRQWLLR